MSATAFKAIREGLRPACEMDRDSRHREDCRRCAAVALLDTMETLAVEEDERLRLLLRSMLLGNQEQRALADRYADALRAIVRLAEVALGLRALAEGAER